MAGPEKDYLTGKRHAVKGEHRRAIAALTPVSPLAGPEPEPAARQYQVAETMFECFVALKDWPAYDRLIAAIREANARAEGGSSRNQRYYPNPDQMAVRQFVLREKPADLLRAIEAARERNAYLGSGLWFNKELRPALRSPGFAAFREKFPEPKGLDDVGEDE